MKKFNRQTGKIAEDYTFNYLTEKGYTIVERNYGNKFGEIDIIAKDKDVLVFVEVKAKIGMDFGMPEEMVGRGKINKVRSMATLYMKGELTKCRLDVVAIVLKEDNTVERLSHYENVY